MTTYWKSIPRKFCDFCKCWITDNRPSVDFHERGKRHQENVKKRIEEVKKKSYEKCKLDEEKEKDMKKMEKAALAAFMKDLENNPELKELYLAKKAAEKAKADGKAVDTKVNKDIKEWYEAKSEEGYTYYWSSITGDSIWEAPKEYMSLAQQEQKATTFTRRELKKKEKKEKKKNKGSNVGTIPLPEVTTAEAGDEVKVRDDSVAARRTYGAWETVHEEILAPLPDTVEDIPLPVTITEEPKRERFKEKKVTTLGSSTNVAFKKRKLTSGARNVRQRDEND